MPKDRYQGIRAVRYRKAADGYTDRLRVVFGPHFFLEILAEPSGETRFLLGATHHGVFVDATDVGGELDQIIKNLRSQIPEKTVDNFPAWEGREL